MSSKKTIAIIIAACVASGVGLAAFALTQGASAPRRAEAVPAGASEAAEAAGPHGGSIVRTGDLELEVVFAEKQDDAQLVVYPRRNGKPIGEGVAVDGMLTRFHGGTEPLTFTKTEAGWTSDQRIAKPHVFDVTFSVRQDGRASTLRYGRRDGVLALTPAQIRSSGIALATAQPAGIASVLQLPGEIRFNEDRTAHVVPRVAGIVERVAVSVGEDVRQGQLLAVIASTDLADRRSELLSAERRLQAARESYERERTLWQEKISAEQDYLQARTQLREAEIATQGARQKLEALNATTASSALSRYELRAPFAGTVVEKHATAGEAIAADANIFTLSDLSSVWAELAVPAQSLDAVRVGREATVKAAAFDASADGRIAYVGSLLGEQTRAAPARVVLSNPARAWRPGMFVNVSVNAGQQDVAVAVERDALQDVDGRPTVFVQSPDGFVAQPVKTGRRDDTRVEVLGGLSAGQQYAAANSFVLKAELGKSSVEED